ncbi:MAG: dihydropteroate synthase, partial [Casimicrobiaceae bacterium]
AVATDTHRTQGQFRFTVSGGVQECEWRRLPRWVARRASPNSALVTSLVERRRAGYPPGRRLPTPSIAAHTAEPDVHGAAVAADGAAVAADRTGAAADGAAIAADGAAIAMDRAASDAAQSARASMTTLRCGKHVLDLSAPRVMGIVNVTGDSFSHDGDLDTAAAIARGRAMLADGAAIIDVGGESTRPDASPVAREAELERVLPVVEALARDGAIVSIDSMKPLVMRAAIDAGASMVNDVLALRSPGAVDMVAAGDVAVCLMHMQGEPRTMQRSPHYDDVVGEVRSFLDGRARASRNAGIAADRIVVDPGFGFGKTIEHNLRLLHSLDVLAGLGYPVLAGLSRKSLLGTITGRNVRERMPASVAAAIAAVERGASIVRVHDVRETVDALKVWVAAGRRAVDAPAA